MAEPDLSYLPDLFACSMPEPVLEIPDDARAGRVKTDDNFLLLDGSRCFIRCRLPLVFRNPGLQFAYVCWLEVARDVYEVGQRLWKEPTTRALLKFRGTLASALPPFEQEVGAPAEAGVLDWRAPNPVILNLESQELGEIGRPPGLEVDTYLALLGEVLREDFARVVEDKLQIVWGDTTSYEDFETPDWRRAPRRQVIAEFQPPPGEPWRYCTLGMSARPMPGGGRAEFAWEVPRRITDSAVLSSMARIAAAPWHLKAAFFDGHVLSVPSGFPPGSDFKFALCYDASRAFSALEELKVFEQPVKVLMPLPILEREAANLQGDETRYLDLKDYLR